MPKRCALGCPPLGVPTHVFPHPEKFPETFKAWVEIAGGKLETPEDYEFYRKKKICDIHFTDGDRNRNHRLNALAVPTLFLPDVKKISEPHLDEAHQRPPLISIQNLTGKPGNDSTLGISWDFTQPSTSKENQPFLNLETSISKENTSATVQGVFATSVPAALDAVESLSLKPNMPGGQLVLQEHNYSKQKYCKSKGWPTLRATKVRQRSSTSERLHQAEINNMQRKINRMTEKNKKIHARLANAEKLNNDTAFKKVTRNMTSPAKIFTKMQDTETTKKPSGRRFSLDQKILSLSLYKRGAKVYSLLSKLFTLPSAKTLRSLLSKIKIGSGLIDIIFDKMKDTVCRKNNDDKLCTLMFYEMSLTPQIHYDRTNDKLKGFTDFENNKIADHVLVFMIKGVKANYKQPVAYYFTNSVNKMQLKNLITDVIKKLQAAGLSVLCTVCDQGAANVGAINELIQESKRDFLRKGKAWRHDFFEVNNKQIIPLFDVPHLLKGMRNNLLNKDLLYIDYNDNDAQKIVKWEYFQEVYQADKCLGEVKGLHKLTEEHVNPEKIKKMRVKNAAQLFSHSVAVITEHLVGRGLVKKDCRQLVPIVILIDNLFDSFNSSTLYIPEGKIYKGPVRRSSPHHQLWQNAIKTFKSIRFIIKKKTSADKVKIVESVAPTVKNFIKTIEGMQVLWRILSRNYSFDAMLTRHFNQDPLENFFGNIRSYGVRNVAPNCISFEGAYKSLLLNNFSSTHSMQANCEKDNYRCLQDLKFFLKENIPSSDVPKEDDNLITHFNEDVLIPNVENDVGQGNYVCGWVLTKCLKKIIKGCKTCKKDFLSNDDRKSIEFIKGKEYNKNKKWLVYPSQKCEEVFKEIQHLTVCTLKKKCTKRKFKKRNQRNGGYTSLFSMHLQQTF